jgi:integrase
MLTAAGIGFADAVDADDELREAAQAPAVLAELRRPRRLDQYLSNGALAQLYVAGVRIEEVRRLGISRVATEDPWGDAGRSIRQLSDVSRSTADQLSEWEPNQEEGVSPGGALPEAAQETDVSESEDGES